MPPFYYHDRMLGYDFGPRHPLRPERLRRAVELIQAVSDIEVTDPGTGEVADVLRVHDSSFVDYVRTNPGSGDYGFGPGDNPSFEGMFEASMAYVAGTAAAARAVVGGAPLAFGLAGGLHHAHRARASGFCIFDDPAIALHILREKYERVAYVDIDLHHGDGVQGLFFDDPTVLTCSIHESGRTLFPGTGFVHETGSAFTSVNVPLAAGTTGEVWLDAFRHGILTALERFEPQAVVLQMGTDAHFADPLGHLNVAAQEWLEALREIRSFGRPIVAVGGGGYNPTTVPRMWASAVLTLAGLEVPVEIPESLQQDLGARFFLDQALPSPRNQGREAAEATLTELRTTVLEHIPRPAKLL